MCIIFLTYLALTCSVGSIKLSDHNGIHEDQTTCVSKSAQACSAADEQTDLQGDDAQSLMQVKLKVHAKYEKDRKEFQELAKPQDVQEEMEVQEVQEEKEEDLEPEAEQIQEEKKEKEENEEEEEDLEPETEIPIPQALLDALNSLNTTTVNGRESACHAEHYIAAFVQPNASNANLSVDCKPCAQNCRDCWGPTMRECVKCKEPFVGLLTRELPRPEFSCTEKCPLCYTKDQHGFCSLNRTCEAEHAASEEILPVNMPANASEVMAIHEMTDGDDAEIPLDHHFASSTNISGIQENTNDLGGRVGSTHRRRRVSDRRRARSTSCGQIVDKMKSEVSGWDKDCYTPVRNTVTACDKRKRLEKALATYQRTSNLVEKGTALPIRLAFKALRFIPWGIGQGLGVLSRSAGIINSKAKKNRELVQKVQAKVNHPTLKSVCTKLTKMHKKVKKGIKIGSKVLDQFSGASGCNCIGTSAQIDQVIAGSKQVRSKCRYLPSFYIGTLVEISLPSWVEDVLNFVKDIQNGLSAIMNHQFCISYFFGRSCWTIGHIVRAISWLLGAITGLVESVVFGLLAALGLNLGCNSITSCIDKYASQYLEMIPGLSFPEPSVPHVSHDITAPEFNLFAYSGCQGQFADVLGGSKYSSDVCDLEDLHNGQVEYVRRECASRRRARSWCHNGVELDRLGVMAVCPADESIWANQANDGPFEHWQMPVFPFWR